MPTNLPTGQSNGVVLLVEVPSSQMTPTYVKMKNHQSQLLSSISPAWNLPLASALAPGLSQPWPLLVALYQLSFLDLQKPSYFLVLWVFY